MMNGTFKVLYRRNGLVFVCKPAGLHLDRRETDRHSDSLMEMVQRELQTSPDQYLTYCHQLDYATSGIICFAETKNAARSFSQLMQAKKIRKQYTALVQGEIRPEEFACDWSIASDPSDPNEFLQMQASADEAGRSSVTLGRVLSTGTFLGVEDLPVSLVEYTLVSGRRHQIRVHSLWGGNPILGDKSYAVFGKEFGSYQKMHEQSSRMMLHATKVQFEMDGEMVNVEVPPDYLIEYKAMNVFQPKQDSVHNSEVWKRKDLAGVFPYCLIQGVPHILLTKVSRTDLDGNSKKGNWWGAIIEPVNSKHVDMSNAAAHVLSRNTFQTMPIAASSRTSQHAFDIDTLAQTLRRGGKGLGMCSGNHGSHSFSMFVCPVDYFPVSEISNAFQRNSLLGKQMSERINNVQGIEWKWISIAELKNMKDWNKDQVVRQCLGALESVVNTVRDTETSPEISRICTDGYGYDNLYCV